MLKLSLDIICSNNSLTSNLGTTTDRTDELVDFSWKPPPILVTIEEWIQTTIEVRLLSIQHQYF